MINDPKPPRLLYNFTIEDVTVWLDKGRENEQVFTLEAGQIKEFGASIADRIEKKLLNRELDKDPDARKNMDKAIQNILKLIRVGKDDI